MKRNTLVIEQLQSLGIEIETCFQSLERSFWNRKTSSGEELSPELLVALQFSEEFTQRVGHLLYFSDQLIVTSAGERDRNSFLHLDVLQLITIEADLFSAIYTIENGIHNKAGLKQIYLLREIADKIFDIIMEEWNGNLAVEVRPFEPGNELLIDVFYSSDGERFVLNWFQNNTNVKTTSELLYDYLVFSGTIELELVDC